MQAVRDGAVTPDTVHMLAQFIRHHRALATSLEKWVNSPTFSKIEADEAIGYLRRLLNAFERSLGATDVK